MGIKSTVIQASDTFRKFRNSILQPVVFIADRPLLLERSYSLLSLKISLTFHFPHIPFHFLHISVNFPHIPFDFAYVPFHFLHVLFRSIHIPFHFLHKKKLTLNFYFKTLQAYTMNPI